MLGWLEEMTLSCSVAAWIKKSVGGGVSDWGVWAQDGATWQTAGGAIPMCVS